MSTAEPLADGERAAVARVYGDAFVDDPGWIAAGPSGRERRRRYVRRVCGGEVWAAPRAGGTVLVTRDDGVPSGAVIFYPMIGLSGLFVPIDSLPPALRTVARVLPLSHSASLLQGIWTGDPWSAHLGDVAALAAVFVVCIAVSSRVFRWE